MMQRAPRPALSLPVEVKAQSKLYFENRRKESERGAFEIVKKAKPGRKPTVNVYGAMCTAPSNCAAITDKRKLVYLGPILGYIVSHNGKGIEMERDKSQMASKLWEINRAIKSGLMLGRVRLSLDRGTIVSTPNKGKPERWASAEALAEAMLLGIV